MEQNSTHQEHQYYLDDVYCCYTFAKQKGEICNKCGDQGVHAALLKCTICKLVREHCYCTVTFPTVSELWICDACGEKKETMQMPHTSSPFSRTKESAKVKFISAEEVASLALGCQTPVSCARRRLCTSVTRTDSILKKPSLMSKSMSTQPTARVELQGYPEEKTSGISTPPGFQPLTVDNETPPKSSSAMNSEDVLASPQPGSGESQLTRSDSRSDLWLSSLHKKNEHLMPPDKALGAQHDRSDFRGSGLLLTFPNGDEIQWRGRLMIKDVGCIHIYEDIQAHFPCRISSKAYDASKSLPEMLQFRFIHRPDNWPKIFQQEPPSFDDVAMFFLPSEFCRRKEKYIRLLERMNNHDLAMCCLLDGFELLIYTSKLLSLDPQKLNTKVYLWGIFRHRRTKKPNQETGFSGEGKHTEAKMQIDMIGGNDTGKADKPVVKRPGMQKEHMDNHRSALLKLQKSHEEQNFPSVPPGFSKPRKVDWNCNKKPLVKLITKKPDSHTISDLPPSFFEQINLKHESGSSKSTGKSLIPPVYEKGNAASNGTRGQHIISCLSAEKVNSMCYQKEQLDNHRSALLKLQKSHEEQNFPSVPPGFSKLRKVDWNCNKKPPVNLITKKPDSHTISDLPPSFFEQINLKHESGSSKSTGKSLIPPVYEKGNAASNGTRGQHIISCLSAEKVNSMCYQSPLIANNSKFRKVTSSGEAPRPRNPAESVSLFSPGYDSPESPSRTNSVLPLFPESKASEGNAAEHQSKGENLVHVINHPVQMVSPDLSLSRPQYIHDRKRWIPAASRDRLEKDKYGKDVQLSL